MNRRSLFSLACSPLLFLLPKVAIPQAPIFKTALKLSKAHEDDLIQRVNETRKRWYGRSFYETLRDEPGFVQSTFERIEREDREQSPASLTVS